MTRAALILLGAVVALGSAWGAYRIFGPSPLERVADLLEAKRWQDAEALAREALEDAAQGDHADLYRALGIAHGRQEEHAEAILAYRSAYALRPEDADLRLIRNQLDMEREGDPYEEGEELELS